MLLGTLRDRYYVVITFSTVGYGDQVPNSEETISRFWAFLCIMFGSMFVALPLAVIGNEFELAYKQVYNAHSNIDTISSAERRQQLLNDAHRVWGTIHVARTQFVWLQATRSFGIEQLAIAIV